MSANGRDNNPSTSKGAPSGNLHGAMASGQSQPEQQPKSEEEVYVGTPPLTAGERAFMHKYWSNEFNFLASHQLKIYNEDDREEGRAILRSLLECEKMQLAQQQQTATKQS